MVMSQSHLTWLLWQGFRAACMSEWSYISKVSNDVLLHMLYLLRRLPEGVFLELHGAQHRSLHLVLGSFCVVCDQFLQMCWLLHAKVAVCVCGGGG